MIESLTWLENVIGTPIDQKSENGFYGGLQTTDGRLVATAEHRRSLAGDVHFPRPVCVPVKHTVDEPCLYGGFFFNHFGHFLVESLGRLWGLKGDLPIYVNQLWGDLQLTSESHYLPHILSACGIDSRRIRVIKGDTSFRKIGVPSQLYGFHLLSTPNPKFFSAFEGVRPTLLNSASSPRAKNIYVSRSKWKFDKGRIIGESDFEDFLVSEGWEILYPEDYPLHYQLDAYFQAESIIFAEGSACHACILLPELRAKIAVIMRRPAGWVQDVFSAQFAGLKKDITIVQCSERLITLGLPSWAGLGLIDYSAASKILRDAGFLRQDFAKWQKIRPEAISRDLEQFVKTIASAEAFQKFLLATNSQ